MIITLIYILLAKIARIVVRSVNSTSGRENDQKREWLTRYKAC
ncbi:hypothetical protein EDF84_102324 [Erwinia rhapontici]|nr:hypothetical protein EDF84_102324 [Erwinia rhapontici]